MLGPGVGPRAREPLGCRAGSASKQDSVGLVELLRREIAELVADDRSVELPVRSLATPAHDRHHEREDLSRRKLLLVIGFPPGVDAVTKTPPSAAGSRHGPHLVRTGRGMIRRCEHRRAPRPQTAPGRGGMPFRCIRQKLPPPQTAGQERKPVEHRQLHLLVSAGHEAGALRRHAAAGHACPIGRRDRRHSERRRATAAVPAPWRASGCRCGRSCGWPRCVLRWHPAYRLEDLMRGS